MFLYIVLPKVNLSKVFFITYAVFKVAELDAVVTPEEQVVSIDQIINPSMLFRDVDTLKVNISSGSFLARISSILIVVDCWSFLFLLFHVLLYNMSVKSFSIRVVL